MAKIERTYNVPLRRGFQKAPRYKRADRAVSTLRTFLKKHMKSEDVKIGKTLNNYLWFKGIKNPPHHVKVDVVKDDDDVVKAEMHGIKYKEEIKPVQKEEGGMKDRIQDKLGIKQRRKTGKEEEEQEEEKEEKKETPKKEPVKGTPKTKLVKK